MKKLLALTLLLLTFSWAYPDDTVYKAYKDQGLVHYEKGNYHGALDFFLKAKAEETTTVDKSELDPLINECRRKSALQNLKPDLKVSTDSVTFRQNTLSQSIQVTKATATWKLAHTPAWCNCTVTQDKIDITCNENPGTVQRNDSIVITMGRLSHTVYIKQEAGFGGIHFKTTPDSATVEFLDKNIHLTAKYSSEIFRMPAGSYHVRISKDGYLAVDTTVTIPAEENCKIATYDIRLAPLFNTLTIKIEPNKGSHFIESPRLWIGSKEIDISPMFTNNEEGILSFDSPRGIKYDALYKRGNEYVIPLRPIESGETDIRDVHVSAEKFNSYGFQFKLIKGEYKNIPFEISMEPISGYLTITDDGNATGAKVFIDNYYKGDVPIRNMKIAIGKHKIYFKKDELKTEFDTTYININEKDERLTMGVAMKPYIESRFESDPPSAMIIVDNYHQGFTPDILKLTEGKHTIKISLAGYMDYIEDVVINKDSVRNFSVTLPKTYPLYVTADEAVALTIPSKEKGKDDIIAGRTLPDTLHLPLGKYKVRLTRANGKTAYKGRINHNGKKDKVKISTFSRTNYQLIGGTYYIASMPGFSPSPLGESQEDVNFYNLMASAYLGQLKICPGLSTSVLRASMFSLNKDYHGQTTPDENAGLEVVEYPKFIFGFSCIFINADFRIGGAIHHNFDINFLGSYAWVPDLKDILPLAHMDGHEAFIGLEASSRLPVFNFSVRLGWQMFKGEYNILCDTKNRRDTKLREWFYSNPYDLSRFALTLSISLGNRDSKGYNMIRIF